MIGWALYWGQCRTLSLYCPQDREAKHARTHYSNERHDQVARNTLITSVVLESVVVSANISFVVVYCKPMYRKVPRYTRYLYRQIPEGRYNFMP